MFALTAHFQVATEHSGAAGLDGAHDAKLTERQRVLRPVGFAVFSENVSQFDDWPRHYFFCFGGFSAGRSSRSRGLIVPATTCGEMLV